MVSAKLVLIETLDIPTVVLIEIGELVVEQHGGLNVRGHVELQDTLAGCGIRDAVGAALVQEGILRCGDGCAGIRSAEFVAVFGGGDVGEGEGGGGVGGVLGC